MIFQLTVKNSRISGISRKTINKHLGTIKNKLANISGDLVVLRLTIRKNIDKYHPPRIHHHPHKTYSDSKPALAYFEGSIAFCLNKKRFYAHFKGQTVDECVQLGFNRLSAEIEKYKDLHFPSESDYPDHGSIREGVSHG
ncbi:MAG: hypothetical protein M1365_10725 [Actinobacteria bacterium]|nr:hypothetical protein [Actinomycetota bacterium]